MCVLPVPGGPSRITFCLACRKSSCPRCSITCFFTLRWKVKSNSSSVLCAGNRAARIRSRPPEDSREEISVDSNASANRSYAPFLLAGAVGKVRPAPARRPGLSSPGTGARALSSVVMRSAGHRPTAAAARRAARHVGCAATARAARGRARARSRSGAWRSTARAGTRARRCPARPP